MRRVSATGPFAAVPGRERFRPELARRGGVSGRGREGRDLSAPMAARLLLRASRRLLARAAAGAGAGRAALSAAPNPNKKRWLRAYLEQQRLEAPPQRR